MRTIYMVLPQPKFGLGATYATARADQELVHEDVTAALRRHANGDWGEVTPTDRDANEQALLEGTRLLSVYRDRNRVKFWIITEADRSATTVLLPDDY